MTEKNQQAQEENVQKVASKNNDKKTATSNVNKKPQKIKTGRGIAYLSFLISIAALAGVSYQYARDYFPDYVPDLIPLNSYTEKRIDNLEKITHNNNMEISGIEKLISDNSQGLDKDQTSKLVAEALSDFAKNQNLAISPDDIKNQVITQLEKDKKDDMQNLSKEMEQKIADTKAELEKELKNINIQDAIEPEQLEKLLEKAVAEQAAKASIDPEALERVINSKLEDKLEKIETKLEKQQEQLQVNTSSNANESANEQNQQIQQLSEKLLELEKQNQQAVLENKNLSAQIEALTQAQKDLNSKNASLDTKDLKTAILQAENSINNGKYTLANKYLASAQNLTKDDSLAEQINNIRNQVADLQDNDAIISEISALTSNIADWRIRKVSKLKQPETLKSDGSISDTAKSLGSTILHSTFRVVRNDEAGLVWLNEHPDLQVLLREQVRLDLTFAKNALLFSNRAAAKDALENLANNIDRLFEGKEAEQASAKMRAMAKLLDKPIPNLSDVINQLSQDQD